MVFRIFCARDSTLSPHLEVICGQTVCHVAKNGGNKCHFSLWIGTFVILFCKHIETETLVNTTTSAHNLLLSRKFRVLVPREGLFSEKNVLRGQIRGKWAFSEVVDNQSVPFSLHPFDLSKLCNEAVNAMEWGCQSYALRASDATCDNFGCGKWGNWSETVVFSLTILF